MSKGLLIREEPPDQPDVLAVLAARDAFSAALYLPESNHGLDLMALLQSKATFLVARRGGAALGCVALVRGNGSGDGEVKSMFVDDAARGTGVGRALLTTVEERARSRDLAALRLETGIHQHAALGLYRTARYRAIGPSGDYRPDPLSVFMEKRLTTTEML